jgi:hypothetical protein
MWPILPFIAGMAAGATVLGVARKVKISPRVNEAVDRAGRKIRQAAVSGLDTIQQSSGRWRDRLATDAEPCECECECESESEPVEKAADKPEKAARPARKTKADAQEKSAE